LGVGGEGESLNDFNEDEFWERTAPWGLLVRMSIRGRRARTQPVFPICIERARVRTQRSPCRVLGRSARPSAPPDRMVRHAVASALLLVSFGELNDREDDRPNAGIGMTCSCIRRAAWSSTDR